jgi:hypothetical protein
MGKDLEKVNQVLWVESGPEIKSFFFFGCSGQNDPV